jgi:phosphatidylinositol alpha 1,6-mannosyltransferase
MRIAVVAESFLPRVNGVSNTVRQVVARLRAQGRECIVIAPDFCLDDHVEGVPVVRVKSLQLPGMPDVDVAFGRAAPIADILDAFGASVVHLASPFILGARAQSAADSLGIPTVAVFQTDVAGFARHYRLGPLTGVADAMIGRIHRRATMTLVPSRSSAAYLHGLGVRRIRSWGRGVDLRLFRPDARCGQLREQLGGSLPLVGYVGRLAPEKRVEALLPLAQRTDIRLVIIGDGPEQTFLRRAMPQARFLGRLTGPELASAMASLDVIVAPGELETFCQVIQEAMASGVPVVAPAVGGPLDLVEHGRDGLLYPPGDNRALVAAVDQLVSSSALRLRICEAGRARVSLRSWDALTDELIGHYEHVCRVNARVGRAALAAAA